MRILQKIEQVMNLRVIVFFLMIHFMTNDDVLSQEIVAQSVLMRDHARLIHSNEVDTDALPRAG